MKKKQSNLSSFVFIGFVGLIGLILLLQYLYQNKKIPNLDEYLSTNIINEGETVIQAPNGLIKVEIATSSQALERGLSGRISLPTNEGMLFVFSEAAARGFWMRNMSFPIDIIWINKNKIVIGVAQNIDPDTYPNIFFPPGPVKYVLELNAGYAEKNGIASGTPLTFTI